MAMESQRNAYYIKYARDHLKRIPLDIRKEYYPIIKEAANKRGESINGFIKEAIMMRLQSGL